MFCQRCGNALAPGARFCNSCGTPVTAPVAPISMARPTLITVIAILNFLGGALMLLAGAGMVAVGMGGKQPDSGMTVGLAAVFLLFGALNLATGIGLWKMREWGRVLQIISAVIGLLGIPVGTIVSILLLVYFTRPHIKLLFSGKRLDQLTPDEQALLAASGTTGSGAATAVVVIVIVLLVVAVIGILAAIAIPNLLTAMERSKQKRTIADMRGVASSVEMYRASHNAPPESIAAPKDAWGTPIRYGTDGTNYWIVSAGKDTRFEEDDFSKYPAGPTTNFDADIVIANGELERGPGVVGRR
jgi:type II secretory pathway pseudopilin PulG